MNEDVTRGADASDPLLTVMRYHEETKHHFSRYARSLGYMDWANQPNPFRRYQGSPLIALPLLKPDEAPRSPLYDDLYLDDVIVSAPVTIRSISRFFEYSLAISAWKQAGDVRWALRTNPSSGNLHPTEGYLLIDEVAGLCPFPGLHHYAAKEHALELRAELPRDSFDLIMREFPLHAFSGWLYFRELAGNVEVWRASFSLLPTRRGTCDRKRAHCGPNAGLAHAAVGRCGRRHDRHLVGTRSP